MAVRFGVALGAVVLTGTGCGGTLEGRYRRGELGPGSSTTTRPPAGAPAPPARGTAGMSGTDIRAGEEPTP